MQFKNRQEVADKIQEIETEIKDLIRNGHPSIELISDLESEINTLEKLL
jgi:hypothetical protein